jgi:hypothetical protein
MKLELSQAELNELVYALGYTQIYGKLRNTEIVDELESKLYKALVIENQKLEKIKNKSYE